METWARCGYRAVWTHCGCGSCGCGCLRLNGFESVLFPTFEHGCGPVSLSQSLLQVAASLFQSLDENIHVHTHCSTYLASLHWLYFFGTQRPSLVIPRIKSVTMQFSSCQIARAVRSTQCPKRDRPACPVGQKNLPSSEPWVSKVWDQLTKCKY